jgi:hypothetical protein
MLGFEFLALPTKVCSPECVERLSGKSRWASIRSLASSQYRAKMSHLALLKHQTQTI